MTEDGDAFWSFSLALYGTEKVPEACLELQDVHGADINLVLYLLFRASRGDILTMQQIAHLDRTIATWRREVVHPLRHARRALKTARVSEGVGRAEALRQRIKEVELEAEKLEQMRLAALGASMDGNTGSPEDALMAYATHLGADIPAGARNVLLTRLRDIARE